jgi:hypothetical protein
VAIGFTDGPANYGRSLKCTWVVSASDPITLRFSEFSTEFRYDYVDVFDGASSKARLLGSFTGTIVPDPVTSTGGALTVVFTSDPADSNVPLTSGQAFGNVGFAATVTLASIDAPLELVGEIPADLGDLQCIGSITHMCVCSLQLPPPTPAMRG